MANTKSAAKRARQTIRRTQENRRVKTAVKNQLKKVRTAIQEGSLDKAKLAELATTAVSVIDKAAKTGQIHKNKADRHKGEFARALASAK
jgi:small subunit ribosomal protein S20